MLTTGVPAAKVALGLPGINIQCVKAGLAAGTFNRRTRYLAAESDADTMQNIQRKMARLSFYTQPWYHLGALETLCLSTLLGPARLNYAFLDFCSPMNAVRAHWLREQFAPQLEAGSQFAITINRAPRNARFPVQVRDYLQHMPTVTTARRALAAIGDYTQATLVNTAMMLDIMKQYVLALEDFVEYANGNSGMLALRFSILATHNTPTRRTLIDRLIDNREDFAHFLMGK